MAQPTEGPSIAKNATAILQVILASLSAIKRYTAGGRDEFLSNGMVQAAVAKKLEVIGQLSQHLPPQVLALHPEVQWHDAPGMQDHLNRYFLGSAFSLFEEQMWETVEEQVPAMQAAVIDLLNHLEAQP
ncbi:MAG TPA: HepT-like ribonuclease domain-containing protein [bacterium]|nr:HepT-like ribonuclease domain-containing protein [bacterium]